MRNVGFSSWVAAKNDYAQAIRILSELDLHAVELSALREAELPRLITALSSLDLSAFSHISIHAPSRLENFTESELIAALQVFKERQWPIIIHPNVIARASLWQGFGSLLYVENMDKRKSIGRTAIELMRIFEELPEASLCLDLAHVRQIDPTLREANEILKEFSGRLGQIHISEVDSFGEHSALGYGAFLAYQQLSSLIPDHVPVIIESVCSAEISSLTRELR